MLVKIVVIVLLIAIVGSLFSGLFFMYKNKGQTGRSANAMSIRIGLSIFAFVLLMVAAATGLITPHGVG